MHPDQSLAPSSALLALATGFYSARAVHLVVELGLADDLASGPRRADEVAAERGLHAPTLEGLFTLLTANGVLRQEPLEDGHGYSLTDVGRLLRRETSDSLVDVVRLFAAPLQHTLWGELEHVLRTGDSAFERALGAPVFQYLPQHPEEAAAFDRAMSWFAEQVGTAVVEAYDFSCFDTVVDVGGGQGRLLTAILEANPGLRGVLFDRPDVVAPVADAIASSPVGPRCVVRGGDMFSEVPAGGDVYLLKSILHDWDDTAAETILGRCRDVMGPEDRLVVIDQIVPDVVTAGPDNLMIAGSSLNMTVSLGGRERKESELVALLANAGFVMHKCSPLGGLERGAHGICSVIEAAPRR